MKNLWIKCILLFSLANAARCWPTITEDGSLQNGRSSKTTSFDSIEPSLPKREASDVVVDDLCRIHGDHFFPATDDSVSIDVHHELFDQSSGLVPFLSYNGNRCFLSISLHISPYLYILAFTLVSFRFIHRNLIWILSSFNHILSRFWKKNIVHWLANLSIIGLSVLKLI